MKCELYIALEELVNRNKLAAKHFATTSRYLRRKRDCPGREAFDKGIQIMDDAMATAIKTYIKHGDNNEK